MLTNAPRGTKDILPDQSYRWQYAEDKFRDACRKFGFNEIRTPLFEHTELFQRGVGDTTDIVQKEMYTFNDHGNRSITLKPEGTASAVRAFLERKQYAEPQPTKYFYITPCYRYEKPQSGRLREFHQFGVEIFGAQGALADAEVICLARDYLAEMGIDDLKLRINSVGCPNCRAKYKDALREYLKPKYDELCDTCKDRYERNPMRIIDCKSPVCKELVKDAPMMLDYLCDDCREHFEAVKKNLTAMNIEFTVDPTIVRGLDYYTKTAFEFVTDQIGAQGTVCGGGRYDNLMEEIGDISMPGVGFGLGIERLLLLMEAKGVETVEPEGPDVALIYMGDKAKEYCLFLAGQLRSEGFSVLMDLQERGIKGQLKYADRMKAVYSVIIGDNELESGVVSVRDMAESTQTEMDVSEITEFLRRDFFVEDFE